MVEDIRPGKTVPTHGINDNILIQHPSYSDVYQYEAKKCEFYKVINKFLGTEPKPV